MLLREILSSSKEFQEILSSRLSKEATMKAKFIFALLIMTSLQVSAQLTTKKVLSCNGDQLQAYFEAGQYGSLISTIVVTNKEIAKHVTKDFPITECGDDTFEKVCWDKNGSLVISTYGSNPNDRAFTWLNSRASILTDKNTRRARFTAWR